MSELIAAAAGLLGAGIGGGAAVAAARMTAKGVLRQTALQQEHADQQWVRDRRREAYMALLLAARRAQEVADELFFASLEGVEPPAPLVEEGVAALRETRAAMVQVDLFGPESMHEPACNLVEPANQVLLMRREADVSEVEQASALTDLPAGRDEALATFRLAASRILGAAG